MEVFDGFPEPSITQPVYLTIGNFDGVHRGHQMLVSELALAAHTSGGVAGLLTFEPHPVAVLRPDLKVPRLTTNGERAELLAALGLDFVIVLPFTRETAATPAADFVATLTAHLPLRELWVGPDFALGRGRDGNTERLAELGRDMGYALRVVAPFDWQGEAVRSSRVRSLLAEEGAVEQAGALLGRPYRVWGEVVKGAQRGQRLGFPTANLRLPEDRLVPAYGVYACWAWRGDTGYPAVVNVGVRPSFDNGAPSVEAYLVNFSGDLYGETLGLSFIQRLRGEKKFADIDQLVEQIRRDVAAAAKILANPPTIGESGAWRELRHTADWSIEVWGTDPRTLFANAGAAMYALQEGDRSQPLTHARAICVAGNGYDELLVAWLNGLLLGQELGSEMYSRFEIFEMSPRGLRGVAYGHPETPAHTGVKAVTYYDLDVRQTDTGWQARVTFDV